MLSLTTTTALSACEFPRERTTSSSSKPKKRRTRKRPFGDPFRPRAHVIRSTDARISLRTSNRPRKQDQNRAQTRKRAQKRERALFFAIPPPPPPLQEPHHKMARIPTLATPARLLLALALLCCCAAPAFADWEGWTEGRATCECLVLFRASNFRTAPRARSLDSPLRSHVSLSPNQNQKTNSLRRGRRHEHPPGLVRVLQPRLPQGERRERKGEGGRARGALSLSRARSLAANKKNQTLIQPPKHPQNNPETNRARAGTSSPSPTRPRTTRTAAESATR